MNLLRLYDFRMPKNILFGMDSVTQVGEKAKELPEMIEEAMNSPLSMINARKPKQEDLVEIYNRCY